MWHIKWKCQNSFGFHVLSFWFTLSQVHAAWIYFRSFKIFWRILSYRQRLDIAGENGSTKRKDNYFLKVEISNNTLINSQEKFSICLMCLPDNDHLNALAWLHKCFKSKSFLYLQCSFFRVVYKYFWFYALNVAKKWITILSNWMHNTCLGSKQYTPK